MKESVDQNESNNNTENEKDPMQRLEEALVLCKFGRFNVRLMFTTLTAVFTSTMVTTTSSYILPIAECDLNMNIMQKGLLNGMPFFGQIGASLFTGFITDAFGRKIFLVGGHIGIFICSICEGSSQTYWMLIMFKMIEGVFLSLCFSATATMVTEFTHKNIRDRMMLLYSSFMSISIIVAALMSWALLPRQWHFVIVEGYFELHSWNIYLYVCSIWSLLATLMYYMLPESPKFLLSHGQENRALEVLKEIYSENTGNPKDTFPVTSLNVCGTYTRTDPDKWSIKKQLTHALYEVKDLFRRPLFLRLLLFSGITFVCLLAYSGLRLWYPQLSTIIENYQKDHGETAEFCTMINDYTINIRVNSTSVAETGNVTNVCIPKLSGSETYINGIIMGFVSLVCIGIAAYLMEFFGQKPLMFILLLLCAGCSGGLYWTRSSFQIAILVSAACGLMQSSFSLQNNIFVRVFPTTLRTLALSLTIMVGRIGSLVGSVLFPVLLESGCMGPFVTLSIITLCVAGLVFFLPNPRKENSVTGDK